MGEVRSITMITPFNSVLDFYFLISDRQLPNLHLAQFALQQNCQDSRMMGKTNTSFEEHLDAALEAEEKGDRYRSGPKAKRFFESACGLYAQANVERPDIPEVLYNWYVWFPIHR